MLVNFIVLVVLMALASLCLRLVFRLWKSKRPLAKWGGVVGLAIPTLLLTVISIAMAVGMYRLYMPRGNPVTEIKVEGTPQQVARGEYIANFICSSCHSLNEQLPLSGGKNLSEDAGIPLGTLVPPNLTQAGRIKDWSDGEIIRAIREGTNRDGHLMPVMGSNNFRAFGEEDLKSIVAFVRSQPPVQNDTPSESFSALAVIFAGAGMIPMRQPPEPAFPQAPSKAVPKEYGHYLASVIGCEECHGEHLTGGAGGLLPKGPTLRTVKQWTPAQFINTMRTGTNPTGRQLDKTKMPWNFIGRLDDEELTALHAYLVSLN